MKCSLREAQLTDAEAISVLSGQLGYAVPVEEVVSRLRSIATQHDHTVIVATIADGRVVAWMDLGIVFHLQSGAYCEIGGLVVAEEARGNGIGREMVAYAERWAADHKLTRVLVRSNAKREDAHRFYLRENYTLVKTSAVFEKKLTG